MRTVPLAVVLALLLVAPPLRAEEPVPSCPFGPGALPAATLPAGAAHGDQIPIDHIVVLMQENRSYDHYFGGLRRRGGPPRNAANPDPAGGKPIRRFHQTRYCDLADVSHSWNVLGQHRVPQRLDKRSFDAIGSVQANSMPCRG
jgi:phospholipase C